MSSTWTTVGEGGVVGVGSVGVGALSASKSGDSDEADVADGAVADVPQPDGMAEDCAEDTERGGRDGVEDREAEDVGSWEESKGAGGDDEGSVVDLS